MLRILVITVVAVAGIAGCGDDDQSDAETAVDAPASTAAEEPAPTLPSASGDLEAWCLGWNGPPIPEGDIQTVFEAVVARAEAVDAVAPAEVEDASRVFLERNRTVFEHLESNDWDPNAPRLSIEIERDMDEAAKALDAYADSNC